MKPFSIAAAFLCCIVAGGCQSDKNPFDPPKPIDKMSKDELCAYYDVFLSNPNLLERTRQTATAKKRNLGCP